MTAPLAALSPSSHTSPAPGGALHTLDLGAAGSIELPLVLAVKTPMDLWPPYAFDVREHCGLRWNWIDIRRFLDKIEVRGHCLIWTGAKSRGQGNHQWYGSFSTQGKTVRAHKFWAVAIAGLRPSKEDQTELDHECHDTLCCHVRVLTVAANRDRIRRPTKRVLDLARFCAITPAEVLRLPPDRIEKYARLMDVTKQIEAGFVPKGVIVKRQKKRGLH